MRYALLGDIFYLDWIRTPREDATAWNTCPTVVYHGSGGFTYRCPWDLWEEWGQRDFCESGWAFYLWNLRLNLGLG